MGQLAKSLRRSGGLGSFGDSLKGIAQILEANRKKEEQKQLFNTIVSLFDKYQQGYDKAKMNNDLKEGGQVNNVFSPENFTGIGGEKPTGLNLKVNVPDNIQSQLSSTPQIPEIQTREISPKERYQRGQDNLYEFVNAIAPLIINPNVDDATLSRINVLSGLAERQTERLKPRTGTVFARDPFKKYVERDDFGEEKVIQEAQTKPEKINLEGSYKNPKTGTYWKYDETSRTGVDTHIPYDKGEGRTTINMPGEYGRLLGRVNKGIKEVESIKNRWVKDGEFYYPTPGSKYYKQNAEGREIGYTEQEYKAIKEEAKSEYLDSAIQLINEQGLDNAVEIIRGGIGKGKPFEEVIKEFKKANPHLDKEDERILRDYFKLMSL